MALETVGVRAVIENLQGYVAGSRQMAASTDAVTKANLNLERVTQQTATSQARAQASLATAQRNLAIATRTSNRALEQARLRLGIVEDQVARRIIEAEIRVSGAKARAASAAQTSAAAQSRAATALATAERNLQNVQIAGAARVVAAQEAVRAAYTAKVERIAAAEAAVATATSRAADIATAGAARQAVAQASVITATARATSVQRAATGLAGLFGRAQGAAAAATTNLGKVLIAVTGFSNRFAVSMRFGAAAVLAFVSALAIAAASKFETTLARIDVLTEATASDVKFLGDEFRRLANTVPRSPQELGSAAYFVLSSGVKDVNEALRITEISAKAATLGLGTTQDVAKTITGVINAYGKENITAAQATDILVAAVQQGSAEASDFAQNIGGLLGIAPQLGVEFDELAAAFATLTNFSLSAAESETALKGILNQLISPSNEAKETLAAAGTSIEELRKNIEDQGLIQALQNLVSGPLKGNIQAFETLFPEVRGLTGALLLFSGGSEKVDENLKAIQNSAGITQAGFERMSQTFDFQANLLKNQLSLALLALGTTILPFVTTAVSKLTEGFRDLLNTDFGPLDDIALAFAKGTVERVILLGRAIESFVKTIKLSIDLVSNLIHGRWDEAWQDFKKIGEEAVKSFLFRVIAVFAVLPNVMISAVEKAANGVLRVIEDLSRKASEIKIAGVDISPISGLEEGALGEINIPRVEAPDFLKDIADATKKANEEFEGGANNLKDVTKSFNDFNASGERAKAITDALSDGIIDFAEATELGLSAIQAGALEATVITRDADEAAFNFTKTLSKVANSFERSREAAEKLVLSLARETLAKLKAAQSAIFSGPTQEVAALELQLANLEAKRAEAALRITPQLEALQDQLDALRSRRKQDVKARTDDPIVAEVIQKGLGEDARGSINDFAESTEAAEEALEEQIAALERELELIDREQGAVQRQIDLYQAQSDVLQAQIQLADKTLLTQKEQADKAAELNLQMGLASAAVRDFAQRAGVDIVEEMDAARNASKLLAEAVTLLDNEHIRKQFITSVDLAAASAQNLSKKLDEAAAAVEQGEIARAAAFETPFQHGGFVNRPTMSVLGEGSRPELVLPLTDTRRSQELLRSLPASFASAISGPQQRSQVPNSIFGDLNVQGPTTEWMRLAAKAEVDRAFRQQAADRRRAGL